jgi:DMSO/TMAO reductase YedYZ molybdopterin-dependent catalytic subunit
MKRSLLLVSALYGFLTGLILLALSYLGNTWFGLLFLPFDLFDWLTRHLPGSIIEGGIRSMVSVIFALHLGPTDTTAKLAEQIQSLGIILITGIIFGLVLAWVALNYSSRVRRVGIWGGVILWIGMVNVEFSVAKPGVIFWTSLAWLLALLVGWGWVLAVLVDDFSRAKKPGITPTEAGTQPAQPEAQSVTRRDFIALAGASLVSLIVLVSGLRKFNREKTVTSFKVNPSTPSITPIPAIPFGPDATNGPAASPSQAALARRIDPAPGTRDEITPPDQFYRIDINTLPPVIDAASWDFQLTGMVQNPLKLTLADIQSREIFSQAVTLPCISNPVGGDLISTNYWSGVRLKDVLTEAVLNPGVSNINVTAYDGFYESIPIEEAMDERTLLVFAMNGQLLSNEHGFPLRVFIPDHYGMKQPKWITKMEVTNIPSAGYWVERGWSMAAIPQTTSVIDTTKVDQNTLSGSGGMSLGGIAYAGARGIIKVEVQIDNDPWQEAQLRTPPVSPLTWVQWRYDWKTNPGSHTIAVRATDGTGAPQVVTPTDVAPDGATGIYRVDIRI